MDGRGPEVPTQTADALIPTAEPPASPGKIQMQSARRLLGVRDDLAAEQPGSHEPAPWQVCGCTEGTWARDVWGSKRG